MLRHVVMWKLTEDEPGSKRENAIKIKAGLEELLYEIHGLVQVDVHIDPSETQMCNADVFMDSMFKNTAAYQKYLEHPHYRALEKMIEACTEKRICMDFECAEFDPTEMPVDSGH